MVAIRILAVASLLAMVAAIAYGFTAGDFSSEGSEILGLAWGRVTLIDLYVGFVIFGAWIAFREMAWWRVAAWWVLLLTLGNLTAAAYLAWAAFRADNARELLMGSRA